MVLKSFNYHIMICVPPREDGGAPHNTLLLVSSTGVMELSTVKTSRHKFSLYLESASNLRVNICVTGIIIIKKLQIVLEIKIEHNFTLILN